MLGMQKVAAAQALESSSIVLTQIVCKLTEIQMVYALFFFRFWGRGNSPVLFLD